MADRYKLPERITNYKFRVMHAMIIIFTVISCVVLTWAVLGKFASSDLLEESYQVQNPKLSLDQLYWRVDGHNAERRVLNVEAFGKVQPACPVLVVQAQRGAVRLQRLLAALAHVRGIDAALLVVSHSFYDDRLNRLVRSVSFCRVLQVYYPYSLQLHPNNFPGFDPADCLARGSDPRFCSNRNASVVEEKQHWWWTAHFVFNHYGADIGHKGMVLFLHEDDYVVPDMLHMLEITQQELSFHADAELISLGRPYAEDLEYDLLTVDPWWPPYDHGLAFNFTLWKKIEALAKRYCTYDDNSWSYSLLNVFAGLPRGHVVMVATVAPRVVGGMDAERARRAAVRARLFPPRVLPAPATREEMRMHLPPYGNGGWNDVRDQLLCLDPFLTTTNDKHFTIGPPSTDETVRQYYVLRNLVF